MAARIGIDTGGTFTDVVRWSPRGLVVHKLPSTPDDPAKAVLAGVAAVRARPDEPVDVVHGTTVGLNAVLQGRLPRTAFVTNQGFRDLIEIGRQERDDLYALEPDRPAPPVPRRLRVEVDCRRDHRGKAVVPLTDAAVASAVAAVRKLRPKAVAIGLLHSPVAMADERRLRDALQQALPDVFVTCSAELWPGLGEYERFSAAILNAAVAPLVSTYCARIERGLGDGRLRLLRSSTGILPPDEAAQFPARALLSGPAGGVLATERLCEALGLAGAAAFDMGGTSTDVCLVDGKAHGQAEQALGGLPLPLPSVAVHTVGCGGGSIAYCDRGGALRLGPQSAGADPGPACYGKGLEPTTTDAHVALGHIGPDTLLGGGFPIDPDRSVRALEPLARKLGLTVEKTARGILAVADAAMARALMRVTGERAVDPAGTPLVAYGGAGGLHAASLAARLGMPMAIAPLHPGAFSAVGLCLAGDSAEEAEARLETWSPAREAAWRRRAAVLCRMAAARVGGNRAAAVMLLRYRGQGAALQLRPDRRPLPTAFRALHEARFGWAPEQGELELVQLRARAEKPGLRMPDPQAPQGPLSAPDSRRPPIGKKSLRVFRRSELPRKSRISGPCLIEEATSVTLVPAGWSATNQGISLRLSQRSD